VRYQAALRPEPPHHGHAKASARGGLARQGDATMPPELPAVRILIVDDDKAICEYMQTLLERDGFQVKTLSDPPFVEEEVRHGGYHLIILDLMMPKLDGIEVLRRIRKLDTDIAVVIFTGFPNLESAVASMKLDAVDYIKKPFNVDEFREVISRVMRKKGLARTPEEQLHRVIGDTIRNLRKEKDLTLKQMSRRTGLSVSLLSQIERAESSASISSLYKIAIALESRIQDSVRRVLFRAPLVGRGGKSQRVGRMSGGCGVGT
jgi:two-component system OmpR family response regulator